jgi:hypothetical protein
MKKGPSEKKKSQPGVVCFGEVLLALSTPHHQRFEQANQFDLTYTGAEANTALALVWKSDSGGEPGAGPCLGTGGGQ